MDVSVSQGAKVIWIYLFIMVYWGYCIYWGIKGALSARTANDYFVAGRTLPPWLFIFAATATSFSAWTFLGHPGLIYSDGLQYAYASFYAITIPLTGVLFLKRQWMLGQHFGFITPGEMLAYYFRSDGIRLLVILVTILFSVPYIGIQLRAAGFLFNALTDGLVGVEFGMWVLGLVVVSYVATGGLRTAAYADILQAVLKLSGIVIIGVIVLYFVGGLERLMEGIAALSQADSKRTPDGYSHYLAIPGAIQFVADGTKAQGGAWTGSMILTYSFALMGIMASPAFSMWAFSSKTPAGFAPQQVWASSLGVGFILIFFSAIQGLGGHFLGADKAFYNAYPELVNPNTVWVLGVDIMATRAKQESLVPELINVAGIIAPWLVGLLAVCALAAIESTASAYMATAGGILARDLFRRFVMPHADDHTQKFAARMAVLAIVLLALLVATTATDALVLLGGLAVSYALQMWPALLAVCYWPYFTRQGITLGLIIGLIVVTLTEPFGSQWFGITAWGRWPLTIHSAGWGLICNLAVALLVSAFTKDDKDRKMTVHNFLREHASLPPEKRRFVPWAWTIVILWFCFAIGPGAVIGNSVFGNPNDPASWWFGMPSIWVWQILGWILGVGMMWFLAYYMEMGTAPKAEPAAEAEESPAALQAIASRITSE
jgi:SSS family solute:Na+ symporter